MLLQQQEALERARLAYQYSNSLHPIAACAAATAGIARRVFAVHTQRCLITDYV
jgi:hypothetical protein